MEYAKNGQLESAAAMLYKADSADVWNEPIQLDNNELHQVAKMMESFPVLSYKIDYIKFYTPVKKRGEVHDCYAERRKWNTYCN